jgi:hypothetical protein
MKSGGGSNRASLNRTMSTLAAILAAASFVSIARAASAGDPAPSPTSGSSDSWTVLEDSPAGASSPSITPALSAVAPSPAAPSAVASPDGSPSAALSKTRTVTVPDSTPAPVVETAPEAPQTTTEIPQTAPTPAPPTPTLRDVTAGSPPADYDDGVIKYEQAKGAELNAPPIRSLQDFMSEGDVTSPLGIEVREEKRKINAGGEAEGLLIIKVVAGSPAAQAGLHAYHRAVRDALETAAVAGALFFPPAVLFVPVLDQVHIGESYDLIIAVDGSRVTNFLDFEDRLHDVQPGEIVYLSIIRNGDRVQVPVRVPPGSAPLY